MIEKLKLLKSKLIALSIAGAMIGTVGCASNDDSNKLDENGVPIPNKISKEYSNVEDYYTYSDDDEILYKSDNVILAYDKDDYDVHEYIYKGTRVLGGIGHGAELYDLPTLNMLAYADGINTHFNIDFYDYIRNNTYQVNLSNVSTYVSGVESKDYYTLEEIKDLEPMVEETLKLENEDKEKVKQK